MERIRLFIGADSRESVGLHVFLESLWRHTSLPVDLTVLTPKIGERLNIKSDGTNAFSTIRFAIPELMNYAGHAIFADGVDMLLRGDLAELWERRETTKPTFGVQVVKHTYRTKHPKKYVGTTLEADNADYDRKNWSSLVLWNCGHWTHLKARDKLLSGDGKYLHRFSWLADSEIGELPKEWNWLVSEYPYNKDAKIAHYTLGLPGFEHYRRSDYAQEWTEHLKSAAKGLQYLGR
jgi:lipopolysaccharide biosynthesis glycosyltransferase